MQTKLKLFALLLVSALSATARAESTTWEIDPVHSSAQFSVKHMMVATVRGEFGKLTGTVRTDGKTAQVDATIDAASINTHEPKRDAHLKSADFFDVAKFPSLTFKSTKAEPAKNGGWRLSGELTMHGVTKPVTFDVSSLTPEQKGLDGTMKAGATATAKVNRKDFGLSWNRPLEAGGVLVGDEVSITVDVELSKKPSQHASR
jgi:polyisoprenoid-binding protein YceI